MPISNRMPRVTVEYDCRGTRKTKTFDNPYEARRFYTTKDRQGKHPKVVSKSYEEK
ncbi:MAG: hypothetical protein RIC55_36240 [Pirellulaceae bacterium]